MEADHESPPHWARHIGARARAARHLAGGRLQRAETELTAVLLPGVEALFPFETARTLQMLGEVRRRSDAPHASQTLHRAAALFEWCGATSWAATIRRLDGLEGDPGPGATFAVEPIDALPPKERRVAEKAALGHTNRQIADELHLRPKTVDHYLQRAFRRLGVKNRTELAATLTATRRQ